MGELLAIDPDLHFPLLVVFRTGDGFNKERGNWHYRNQVGHMEGPFLTEINGNMHMVNHNPLAATPMREPFKHGSEWWWKKDTPKGISFAGPYLTEIDAGIAINEHVKKLNEKAHP